ncbi:DUF6735 family protein [Halorussus ruber]|uniref:DUF6735 family protein n=1 Tax=Halorussus ruber TaxID=1126238 RepID=UPI001091EE6D|nr:DUF6735 family protein [Halorussus ruber]
MGHRALLAYRRDDAEDSAVEESSSTKGSVDEPTPAADSTADARYDLHRSHWGGADFALLDRLSADAPFAAESAFAVDPEPIATDCSLADIVRNYLDFLHHEAFYRVGPDYATTAFHVCWFGLEIDSEEVAESETVGHGALVEADPAEADYFRGWFRGTKAVVGDAVDRGCFAPGEATDYLAERMALWDDDREVLLPE